jgi:site-specific DNA-cytosine methylase
VPAVECAAEAAQFGGAVAVGEVLGEFGEVFTGEFGAGDVVVAAEGFLGVPGEADFAAGVAGCEQAAEFGVGAPVEAFVRGEQQPPDPIQGVVFAAAVAEGVVLDSAADLVDAVVGEADHMERIRDLPGAGQRAVEGGAVRAGEVQDVPSDVLAPKNAAVYFQGLREALRSDLAPLAVGDSRGTTTEEILRAGGFGRGESPDLLIGGPPCVAFSKSGFWLDWKRNGADPAAGLLQAYTTVLAEARPRYFICENVYALTFRNRASGPAFAGLLKGIKAAGYCYRWEVLNAADYGVPQLRPRLFILGARRGEALPELPDASHYGSWERRCTGGGPVPHVTNGEALAGFVTEPEPEEVVRGKWGHLLPDVPPGDNYCGRDRTPGTPRGSRRRFARYSNQAGTERSYPDIELAGSTFGDRNHAADIKCARRSKSGTSLQSSIALYTGNTYVLWPQLNYSGILRPYDDHASHLVIVVIYDFHADRPERISTLQLVAHESWCIASRKRASATREYIGSVRRIEDLIAGQGEFESREAFETYWRSSARNWKKSPEAEKLLRRALDSG